MRGVEKKVVKSAQFMGSIRNPKGFATHIKERKDPVMFFSWAHIFSRRDLPNGTEARMLVTLKL